MVLKAPFPWFGGKSEIASQVWESLGDVPIYVEPFFGSGAVLLSRPTPFSGIETVNDADGLLANFWRAVRADPEAVAAHADWPVLENDLHARHAWLVGQKEQLQARLEGDPDFFDAKAAGWWVWGIGLWIGSGFCRGEGPWQVCEVDGTRQLVHLGNAGQGVHRQLVHLGDAGQGVHRQRVHLGDAGQGVRRKLVHLGNAGKGVHRKRVHLGNAGKEPSTASADGAGAGERGLCAWMQALADRLERVRVCCGDWTRVCGGRSGNALKHLVKQTPCGVFLDPPYADTANRESNLYRKDSLDVAHAVREWAIRYGDDPRFRIVLCGYDGEHQMPDSWQVVPWKANGGYSSQAEGQGRENATRERLWLSPHCRRGFTLFDNLE